MNIEYIDNQHYEACASKQLGDDLIQAAKEDYQEEMKEFGYDEPTFFGVTYDYEEELYIFKFFPGTPSDYFQWHEMSVEDFKNVYEEVNDKGLSLVDKCFDVLFEFDRLKEEE